MSTQRANIDQAKDQLADLIATASEGGEVIIVENGKALARLIPATDAAAYESHPIKTAEFSSDEEALAWMLTVGRTSLEARRDPLVHVSTS